MGSSTLFEQFRQNPNNEGIWAKLVEHYSPWVFAWAKRQTRRDDIAEDIVQNLFLRMWQKRAGLLAHPANSLRSWIGTVVLHLIQDWGRDRWRGAGRLLSGDDREKLDANGDDGEGLRPGRLALGETGETLEILLKNLQARLDVLEEHYLELAEECEHYVEAWESLVACSEMTAPTVLSFLHRVRGGLKPDEAAARLELTPEALNNNVMRVRRYLAGQVGWRKEHARRVDELDVYARQSRPCAVRLKECAEHYGYTSDA